MPDEKYISMADLKWLHKKEKSEKLPKSKSLRCYIKDGLGFPDDELIEMHVKQHLSAAEIGRRKRIWGYYVGLRLKALKIYEPNKKPLRRKLNIKHIKHLYMHGYSPREIAAIVGVSHNTIARHLKREGGLNPYGSQNSPVSSVKKKALSGVIKDERMALKKFGHKNKTSAIEKIEKDNEDIEEDTGGK